MRIPIEAIDLFKEQRERGRTQNPATERERTYSNSSNNMKTKSLVMCVIR